ncbi:MAG: hypothetical protein ACRC0G_00820 [Fusobacteriaceae bacterium]
MKLTESLRNFFSRGDSVNLSEDANKKDLTEKNIQINASAVLGRHSTLESETLFFTNCKEAKRQRFMCENMDELLEQIKTEITTQPLLARVIRNISKGVLKNGYSFYCINRRDSEIEKEMKKRFDEIIYNSGYEESEFLQEVLMDLIKYSNAFVKPIRNEKDDKLMAVLHMQNKGFTVVESIGTGIAKKFKFERKSNSGLSYVAGESRTVKYFDTPYNMWHCAFGKETDEIFGMPIWVSVIPVLKKYNYLISSSIDSYSDQSIEKTIYRVGFTKSGISKPVTPESFRSLKNELQINDGEDIITDVPVDPVTVTKSYTSPDKILDILTLQVIAGLFTSESQLGKSGAGRVDSETQQSNTDGIVSEFQKCLENYLNRTIVRELSKDIFKDATLYNQVKIKFNSGFNDSERVDKNAVYKFQAGLIDLDEARIESGYLEPMNPSKTMFNLYTEKEPSGTVENTNRPANGTGKTNTTKKSSRQ